MWTAKLQIGYFLALDNVEDVGNRENIQLNLFLKIR